jgi:hypothetical protein
MSEMSDAQAEAHGPVRHLVAVATVTISAGFSLL